MGHPFDRATQSTKPLISTLSSQAGKKKRKYKLSDRMTVEEIFENVDSQSHLTFDYLMMVVVAAIIAGVGLISDSSVTVVASMLVSTPHLAAARRVADP